MKTAVVIPCYNHERYIGDAIESVLNQTRPPERVLVIDDGSSDNSVQVIRRYEKDGVECIAQENAGAHNTLNRAVEIVSADCDVISILNSDDFYEPARFERCLPRLQSSGRAVISTALKLIDDDGKPLPEEEPRAKWFRAVWSLQGSEDLTTEEWMAVANFVATSSNVIGRANWLRRNPFRPYRFNHDYFFLATTALHDQLEVIPEPLVRYRVHATNTINSAPAPLLREMLRMHLDLYHHLGPALRADPGLRDRFHRYSRAAWNSVSSLHAGLLQTLLAELAADAAPEKLEHLVQCLEAEELDHYPNSALVHQFDGSSPLLAPQGLAERVGHLKRERASVKAENTSLKELNRLRAHLQESRWLALGRLFGAGERLASNTGKTPEEKLAQLHAAMDESAWLKLGRRIGCWSRK